MLLLGRQEQDSTRRGERMKMLSSSLSRDGTSGQGKGACFAVLSCFCPSPPVPLNHLRELQWELQQAQAYRYSEARAGQGPGAASETAAAVAWRNAAKVRAYVGCGNSSTAVMDCQL